MQQVAKRRCLVRDATGFFSMQDMMFREAMIVLVTHSSSSNSQT